jgi:small multidrug resistance pump
MNWLYLAAAILAEVCATSALKASEGFTRPVPAVICLVGYSLAMLFLSFTLRTIPVGVAYAVWSGVGIVLITAVGWFFFEQKIDAAGFVGIGLILAGVLVLHLVSKSANVEAKPEGPLTDSRAPLSPAENR